MSDYHFEYDATNSVLAVRVTGRFTDAVFRAFYADTPRYMAGRDVRAAILDLSGAADFDVSADVLERVAG